MKTYAVLYAEDLPIYGATNIRAADDNAAIELAIKIHERGEVILDDIAWKSSTCARIVAIETDDGETIVENMPLDEYRIFRCTDADDRIAAVAVDLLEVLKEAVAAIRDVIAAAENDDPYSLEELSKLLVPIKDRANVTIRKCSGESVNEEGL